MSFWSGFSGGSYQGSLWEAIRSCNILIDNIDLVIDMEQQEKNEEPFPPRPVGIPHGTLGGSKSSKWS